jgi:hypothetical protein
MIDGEVCMGATRTSLYLDPKIHRALKMKAAETGRSVTDLINEALVEALREDAIDLEAVGKRAKEASRPFEQLLAELKRDGLL